MALTKPGLYQQEPVFRVEHGDARSREGRERSFFLARSRSVLNHLPREQSSTDYVTSIIKW